MIIEPNIMKLYMHVNVIVNTFAEKLAGCVKKSFLELIVDDCKKSTSKNIQKLINA